MSAPEHLEGVIRRTKRAKHNRRWCNMEIGSGIVSRFKPLQKDHNPIRHSHLLRFGKSLIQQLAKGKVTVELILKRASINPLPAK